MTTSADYRQRFYIENSPVRGDAVRLSRSYANIIAQKDYPQAIKCLLGEMLTAASLLIGTLKIEGRLSLQLQSSDEDSLLEWAMAECDHDGNIRGLVKWKNETATQQQAWTDITTANQAFAELGKMGKGVLFINIQPAQGKSYQGIVERCHDNLADCLAHYQKQSAQIPTLIKLACDGLQTGGLLVQMLPLSQEELMLQEQDEQIGVDDDLWTRLSLFTRTVKAQELTKLDSNEILYLLYNEEEVVTPDRVPLTFGCTCSEEKSESAIFQLGKDQALECLAESAVDSTDMTLAKIELDCGFCGSVYEFTQADIMALFAE